MAEGPGGDRTEAATPRRLQRAREAGQAPVSRELPVLAALGAGGLVLAWSGPGLISGLAHQLASLLQQPDRSDGEALQLAGLAGLHAALPLMLAPLLAGAAAVFLQTGFLISAAPLAPDLQRINPARGLARLFSRDSIIEAGKSLAKLAAVAIVLWHALAADIGTLGALSLTDLRLLPARAAAGALHVVWAVLGVQAAITTLDVLWTRLRHADSLRMTRQDVRDEQKETEGDPKIKARIRRIRQGRARRRMMAAVPKATVVVTNPTHYAVALAYDRASNAAPRLVAKGVDSMAERIREVAKHHAVPIVANPPLARALYPLELDTDIPPEHYKAVAEIIAYVWRLRGRAAISGVR